MQQSNYFAEGMPHPTYFDVDENGKKCYFHVRLKQFNYNEMDSCYIQTFQGITCSSRINFTVHFFTCTSFPSDYLGNEKGNYFSISKM